MTELETAPLTPRAERVIAQAQRHAQQWNHQHLGTEHLLLGLLDEPDGIAGQVLSGFGDLRAIRSRVTDILGSPGYHTRSILILDGETGEVALDEHGQPIQRHEIRHEQEDGTVEWRPLD